ncbi:MAG: tyrosine-type recombinase/integrase [Deltaproteobacteria bacterium]|nr:tyrosine-type recombinase/integrase [Deltaproteobacteria bacterium]
MWASRGEVELRAAKELIAPTVKATPPPPTVGDVLDWWLAMKEADPHLRDKSKAAYRQVAVWLVVQLGRLEPHEISAEMLRRLVAEAGLAPMTLRQRFGILFQALRSAEAEKIIPSAPSPPRRLVGDTRARKRATPTRQEIAEVIAQLPDDWVRMAARVLAATGMRPGELASAKVSAWDGARLHVDGKTGPRSVPVLGPVASALTAWVQNRAPDEYLLGISPTTIGRRLGEGLHEAGAAVGLPHLTPYGLRRAAVRSLLKAGVDVRTAADVMGHSPAVMLAAYAESDDADREAAVRRAGLGEELAAPSRIVKLAPRQG